MSVEWLEVKLFELPQHYPTSCRIDIMFSDIFRYRNINRTSFEIIKYGFMKYVND